MRSKLFIALLMAALAIPMANAQKLTVPMKVKKTTTNVVRHKAVSQVHSTEMTKLFNAPKPIIRATRDDEIPQGYCRVTLEAHDVWGDGSGYQMLFDADTVAIGPNGVVPETGPLTTSGDASSDIYDLFEYKIPENADGSLTTENVIVDGSVSILIPAGVYDYVITNPTPDDRVWIASDGGDVPGRWNNVQFSAGINYVFTITLDESSGNDAVGLTATAPGQAGTAPESTSVEPGSTNALVTWVDDDDMYWILRYREHVESQQTETILWDFEDTEWMNDNWYVIDADGDGNGWNYYSSGLKVHSGSGALASASYDNNSGALTPDNWIITPVRELHGKFSFWYRGQDPNWAAETFRVYMLVGSQDDVDNSSTDDFVEISNGLITATGEYQQFVYDLSAYEGQTAAFAIRHCEVTDMFYLVVDDICIGDPDAESGAQPWTYVDDPMLEETHYTIEGLTPETTYEVQVAGVTAAGNGYWGDLVLFTTLAETPAGLRGDVNDDEAVNITDVILLINAVLSGNLDDINADNADVNFDTSVNITDVIQLINYVSTGNWPD